MLKKLPLLLLGALCFTGSLFSQEVRIEKMEFNDNVLSIQYEIEDSNPNNEYLVNIYCSANSFSAPLTKVSGAVGEEVRPGSNMVKWDVLDELGEYNGNISIEIRARVFIPFARLKDFGEARKFKKGTQTELEWRPGNTNPVHIELYKDNTRLQGELNHPNNGKYTISFSKDLKPGDNYRIKVTDSKSPDTFIYTPEFKIKSKIPLIAKIVPVLIVGYLATTLGSGQTDDNTLPNAPAFPDSN